MQPTLSVGGSLMVFDYGGDDTFRGWALRGGAAVGWFGELTAGFEHWPVLGSYNGWALEGEGTFYPLGRRRVAPYLMLHLGHFWGTLPPALSYIGELSGRTIGLTLGMHGRIVDPVGVRLEAVVRYDAGGADPALRGFITYTPGIDLPNPPSDAGAVVYDMLRASGPWRFVEPGYALKFATEINDRDAAALTIAMLHWRITQPGRPLTTYLWDTRAVLLMPALRRGWGRGTLRWAVQAGPSVTLMFEGPDMGLRGGANAEVSGSVGVGPLPRLTAGIGWVWIVRGYSEPAVPTTDERGLLFHAGLTF